MFYLLLMMDLAYLAYLALVATRVSQSHNMEVIFVVNWVVSVVVSISKHVDEVLLVLAFVMCWDT